MLVKGWIIVEHTSIGYRSCAPRMQHVALAQRSANVRGFRDVGRTLAQLVFAGWVTYVEIQLHHDSDLLPLTYYIIV